MMSYIAAAMQAGLGREKKMGQPALMLPGIQAMGQVWGTDGTVFGNHKGPKPRLCEGEPLHVLVRVKATPPPTPPPGFRSGLAASTVAKPTVVVAAAAVQGTHVLTRRPPAWRRICRCRSSKSEAHTVTGGRAPIPLSVKAK